MSEIPNSSSSSGSLLTDIFTFASPLIEKSKQVIEQVTKNLQAAQEAAQKPVSPEEFKKLTKATEGPKVDLKAVDPHNGYIKDAELQKRAKENIKKAIEDFPRTPAAQELKIKYRSNGEPALKKAVLNYLQSNTEFPLLPPAEQKALLAELKVEHRNHSVGFGAADLKEIQPLWSDRRRIAQVARLQAKGHKEKGDLKTASGLYDKAAELYPLDPELRFEAGVAFQALGDKSQTQDLKKGEVFYLKALGHFKGAVDHNPSHWRALKCFGQIMLKAERNDEAKKIIEQAQQVAETLQAPKGEQDALRALWNQAHRQTSLSPTADLGIENEKLQKVVQELALQVPGLTREDLADSDVIPTSSFDFYSSPAEAFRKKLEAKGVKPEEVRSQIRSAGGELRDIDYIDYAFKNHPLFQKELEERFGELPSQPSLLREEAAQHFKDQGLQAAKIAGLRTQSKKPSPKDLAVAIENYKKAGEFFEKAHALTGKSDEAHTAARFFYEAARLTQAGGDRTGGQKLYLQGAEVLKGLHSLPPGENILKDPKALLLLARGLRESGQFKESLQILARAHLAGEKSEELTQTIRFTLREKANHEALGDGYFGQLKDLEAKANSGETLEPSEKKELSFKRKGLAILARSSAVSAEIPLHKDGKERRIFQKLRKEVLDAVQSGIPEELAKAGKIVDRLEKFLKKIKSAEQARMRHLSQSAPYIQEFVLKNRDWSVLQHHYSHSFLDFDHNVLNNYPFQRAFARWKKSNPSEAENFIEAFQLFQRSDLLPDGMNSLSDLEKAAETLEKKTKVVSQAQTLLVDLAKKEELKEPASWVRNGVDQGIQNLKQTQNLLTGLKEGQKDLVKTLQELEVAKKAGNSEKVQILTKKIEIIQESLKNCGKALSSMAQKMRQDIPQLKENAQKLGKLESHGELSFAKDLEHAVSEAEKIETQLKSLPEGPQKALESLIQNAQGIVRVQATFLKSLTFTHSAVAGGFNWGRKVREGKESHEIEDPGWKSGKSRIEKLSVPTSDAESIGKFLGGVENYLRETDEKMFHDLPTTLKQGIDTELRILNEKRNLMMSFVDVGELENLMEKLQKAKEALEAGDTSKALSIYRLAQEGRHASKVREEIAKFKTPHEKARDLAIQIVFITAASVLTSGTMSLIASQSRWFALAQGLHQAGAATVRQGAAMYLTQAALFVGYEKGLKAVFSGENPFLDEKGNRKSMPTFLADLFVEVGKMALMFKFLGWWQTRYRVSTVGQSVLKDPMAKEILQEAFAASPRLGRGLFNMMMQEEIAARGLLRRMGVKVEAFAAEAAGFQVWTNIGVTLDTFYQNVAHGKKLVWREQIIAANKPEAMLEGIANLVGLKLGGLGTHPAEARMTSARSKAESQAIQVELKSFEAFARERKSLESRLNNPQFLRNPNLLEKSTQRVIQLGDQVYGKGRFVPDSVRLEWEEARALLNEQVEWSQKIETRRFENGDRLYPVPVAGKTGEFQYKRVTKEGITTDADKESFDFYMQWWEEKAAESVKVESRPNLRIIPTKAEPKISQNEPQRLAAFKGEEVNRPPEGLPTLIEEVSVSPTQVISTREELISGQIKRAHEIGQEFSLGKTAQKNLDWLVHKDIQAAEKEGVTEKNRRKLIDERMKAHLEKAPASQKNDRKFIKALRHLVEENIRGVEGGFAKSGEKAQAKPDQASPLTFKGELIPKGAVVLEGEGAPSVVPFGEKGQTEFAMAKTVEPNLLFGKNEKAHGGRGAHYLYLKEGDPVIVLKHVPGDVKKMSPSDGEKVHDGRNSMTRYELQDGDVLSVNGRSFVFRTHEGLSSERQNSLPKAAEGPTTEPEATSVTSPTGQGTASAKLKARKGPKETADKTDAGAPPTEMEAKHERKALESALSDFLRPFTIAAIKREGRAKGGYAMDGAGESPVSTPILDAFPVKPKPGEEKFNPEDYHAVIQVGSEADRKSVGKFLEKEHGAIPVLRGGKKYLEVTHQGKKFLVEIKVVDSAPQASEALPPQAPVTQDTAVGIKGRHKNTTQTPQGDQPRLAADRTQPPTTKPLERAKTVQVSYDAPTAERTIPNAPLDYSVGTAPAKEHVADLAREMGLWDPKTKEPLPDWIQKLETKVDITLNIREVREIWQILEPVLKNMGPENRARHFERILQGEITFREAQEMRAEALGEPVVPTETPPKIQKPSPTHPASPPSRPAPVQEPAGPSPSRSSSSRNRTGDLEDYFNPQTLAERPELWPDYTPEALEKRARGCDDLAKTAEAAGHGEVAADYRAQAKILRKAAQEAEYVQAEARRLSSEFDSKLSPEELRTKAQDLRDKAEALQKKGQDPSGVLMYARAAELEAARREVLIEYPPETFNAEFLKLAAERLRDEAKEMVDLDGSPEAMESAYQLRAQAEALKEAAQKKEETPPPADPTGPKASPQEPQRLAAFKGEEPNRAPLGRPTSSTEAKGEIKPAKVETREIGKLLQEMARPYELIEQGLSVTPDISAERHLLETLAGSERLGDKLERILNTLGGYKRGTESSDRLVAYLSLAAKDNPSLVKFLRTATDREITALLQSPGAHPSLVEKYVHILASDAPHQFVAEVLKIENPQIRNLLIVEILLKEFRLAKANPDPSTLPQEALNLLHMFGIDPKDHPQFPWNSADLSQRAALFVEVTRKKAELTELFKKAAPHQKPEEVERFINEVWEVIRTQDVQDTILPYTPHGWGHSLEVLAISDRIFDGSPSVRKALAEKFGSESKARAVLQFIGLFHDAGYGCLAPHESKGLHAERSGHLFQEKFRQKISDLLGIKDTKLLDEIYLAIDRHGADKPHEANYLAASEKDHPLLLVVRLADNLDLTTHRMREIQTNPQVMGAVKEIYDRYGSPQGSGVQQLQNLKTAKKEAEQRLNAAKQQKDPQKIEAAQKEVKQAETEIQKLFDPIREKHVKGIQDPEDAALARALLSRLNESTWPHFVGCERAIGYTVEEIIDPTTQKPTLVVKIDIKGKATAGNVYEKDTVIDGALYQVYRAYVAAKSLQFNDQPLVIRYRESERGLIPGLDVEADLKHYFQGIAPVTKTFTLQRPAEQNQAPRPGPSEKTPSLPSPKSETGETGAAKIGARKKEASPPKKVIQVDEARGEDDTGAPQAAPGGAGAGGSAGGGSRSRSVSLPAEASAKPSSQRSGSVERPVQVDLSAHNTLLDGEGLVETYSEARYQKTMKDLLSRKDPAAHEAQDFKDGLETLKSNLEKIQQLQSEHKELTKEMGDAVSNEPSRVPELQRKRQGIEQQLAQLRERVSEQHQTLENHEFDSVSRRNRDNRTGNEEKVPTDPAEFITYYLEGKGKAYIEQGLNERDSWALRAEEFQAGLEQLQKDLKNLDRLLNYYWNLNRAPEKTPESLQSLERLEKRLGELKDKIRDQIDQLEEHPYHQMEQTYNSAIYNQNFPKNNVPPLKRILYPLDQTLGRLQINATSEGKRTGTPPQFHYELVFKGPQDLRPEHLDEQFKNVPVSELVSFDLKVATWEMGETVLKELRETRGLTIEDATALQRAKETNSNVAVIEVRLNTGEKIKLRLQLQATAPAAEVIPFRPRGPRPGDSAAQPTPEAPRLAADRTQAPHSRPIEEEGQFVRLVGPGKEHLAGTLIPPELNAEKGTVLESWQITDIKGDQITLRRGNREMTLRGEEGFAQYVVGDKISFMPGIAGASDAPVIIDGLFHQSITLKSAEIRPAPTPPNGVTGLDAWVGQMTVGQVYQFEGRNEAGNATETNYAFRDRQGNLYVIPQWMAEKIATHGTRGSEFQLPLPTVLQAMADGVAASTFDNPGRYELRVVAEGQTIGLDRVVREETINKEGLKGRRVTVDQDLDQVETFVVSDQENQNGQTYGTPRFMTVFLDGNPDYAKPVAAALEGFGVSTESWRKENKGRIRTPVTAFPGKDMPQRQIPDPSNPRLLIISEKWKGHRTLRAESDIQVVTQIREDLKQQGLWETTLRARDDARDSKIEDLNRMLSEGELKNLPENFKNLIKEKLDALEAALKEASPNARTITNAKGKVVQYIEAALLLNRGATVLRVKGEQGKPDHFIVKLANKEVTPGLLFSATPEAMEVLLASQKSAPPSASPKLETLASPFPQFQKSVDAILARVPSEKKEAARKAMADAFSLVPKDANPQTVGKVLGSELKKIEAVYAEAPKARAPKAAPLTIPPHVKGLEGPNVSKLSQAEVDLVADLQERGLLDETTTRQLMSLDNFERVSQALSSAKGNLEKADKGEKDPSKPDPLISVYTGLHGALFEIVTAERGKKLPGADPSDPRNSKTVKVAFREVKEGKLGDKAGKPKEVDNDVPVIPGRVWETKRYPRLNYGSSDAAINQILKYQAAISEGHFDAATVEVAGNLDPAFLKIIRTGQLADGTKIEIPNVEVLYRFRFESGREAVITIKEGKPREGSEQKLASVKPELPKDLSPQERQAVEGMEQAIKEGNFEPFSNHLTEADIKASSLAGRFPIKDGAVDPKQINDLTTFKEFERILYLKRMNAFGKRGAPSSTPSPTGSGPSAPAVGPVSLSGSARQAAQTMQNGAAQTQARGERRATRAVGQIMARGALRALPPGIEGPKEASPAVDAAPQSPEKLTELAKTAQTEAEKTSTLAAILNHEKAGEILTELGNKEKFPSKIPGHESVLEDLLPDLAKSRHLTQDPRLFGQRTVQEQALHNLRQTEAYLKDHPLPPRQALVFRMAALFLDMGKHEDPQIKVGGFKKERMKSNGEKAVNFFGYQERSAELFQSFAGQTLSQKEIILGRHLILRHLDAINLITQTIKSGQEMTPEALKGFIKRLALENHELLMQGMPISEIADLTLRISEFYIRCTEDYPGTADSQGKIIEPSRAQIALGLARLKDRVRQELPSLAQDIVREHQSALINGEDILTLGGKTLKNLGEKTYGPLIEEIKRKVLADWEGGKVNTREEALQAVNEMLASTLQGKGYKAAPPHEVKAIAERVKDARHLLGIEVAGPDKVIQDASGQEVARIRYFRADPTPEFYGEIDPKELERRIKCGKYPTLQAAYGEGDGQVNLDLIKQALTKKGFHNLVEIELFLKDKDLEGTPREKLTLVETTTAPTAPLMEISRKVDGNEIKVHIDRGWQGNFVDHKGKGGIHFSAQRSKDLKDPKEYNFQRPGETDEAMLTRFILEVTLPILTAPHLTEIPSDRDPKKTILIGKASDSSGGFGLVVVDKADPKNWRVVTNMYRPNAKDMRNGLAAYTLKQLFKRWGKDTPQHPDFQKAVTDVNRFLEQHGQPPLTGLSLTAEEHLQGLKDNIRQFAVSQGIKENKAETVVTQLLPLLKSRFNTVDEALSFLRSEDFKKTPEYKKEIESKIEKPSAASKPDQELVVPLEEIPKLLMAQGISGRELGIEKGKILGKIKNKELTTREEVETYIRSLAPASEPAQQKWAASRETAPEQPQLQAASLLVNGKAVELGTIREGTEIPVSIPLEGGHKHLFNLKIFKGKYLIQFTGASQAEANAQQSEILVGGKRPGNPHNLGQGGEYSITIGVHQISLTLPPLEKK